MGTNLSGLMADNGYDYPSETELRNIFASSCVEAAARKLQIPAVEMYRRMKRVHLNQLCVTNQKVIDECLVFVESYKI